VLSGWCESVLGAPSGRILFRRRHLSQVLAAELTDGRRVVVKARPFEERIAGCAAVQAALGAAGFPCPALIAGPVRIGGLAVTAETLIPGGDQLSPAYGAMPFAALLARLIATAPPVTSLPSLRPSPPWTGWDHPGARLWPDRDDRGRDLNETPGPGWVDRAARLVREQLRACEGPRRAGHGDWESQNIRWDDGKPLAVHDWDSVIAQPDVAIVGLAAAVWPAAGGRGQAATPAQTAEFLSAYQAAAGTSWTRRQVQMAWAAGLWVRLFNAKKDAADGGGPQLERLAGEITERLSRAGFRRLSPPSPRSSRPD
jgi:Phosphotransferase enzyme family